MKQILKTMIQIDNACNEYMRNNTKKYANEDVNRNMNDLIIELQNNIHRYRHLNEGYISSHINSYLNQISEACLKIKELYEDESPYEFNNYINLIKKYLHNINHVICDAGVDGIGDRLADPIEYEKFQNAYYEFLEREEIDDEDIEITTQKYRAFRFWFDTNVTFPEIPLGLSEDYSGREVIVQYDLKTKHLVTYVNDVIVENLYQKAKSIDDLVNYFNTMDFESLFNDNMDYTDEDIEHFIMKNNILDNMKEYPKYIKALLSIELDENNSEILDELYEYYIRNDITLIDDEHYKNLKRIKDELKGE